MVGDLNFWCEIADLDYVANIVSKKLTYKEGSFGGKENYIYDEVPAMYFDFFGLRFCILQNPEDLNIFTLRITDRIDLIEDTLDINRKEIDLSERLYFFLKECEGFKFLDYEN